MNIDKIINAAADKFCGWKLPKDFYPDCYISFDREKAYTHPHSGPTGTNLFTHEQAKAMFRYCIEAALSAKQGEQEPVAWATTYMGFPNQFFKEDDAEEQAKAEIERLNREYPQDKHKRAARALYTHPATVNTALLERITKLEQALGVALEALETYFNQYPHMQKGYTLDAIEILKEVRK